MEIHLDDDERICTVYLLLCPFLLWLMLLMMGRLIAAAR